LVAEAISGLPERQQHVIRLRDIEGWSAEEVCESLGLSAANQRVLLHRARANVRAALEVHFSELVEA
jgi:RNA polymerase sigma-70 factor (ECF subfamily)